MSLRFSVPDVSAGPTFSRPSSAGQDSIPTIIIGDKNKVRADGTCVSAKCDAGLDPVGGWSRYMLESKCTSWGRRAGRERVFGEIREDRGATLPSFFLFFRGIKWAWTINEQFRRADWHYKSNKINFVCQKCKFYPADLSLLKQELMKYPACKHFKDYPALRKSSKSTTIIQIFN